MNKSLTLLILLVFTIGKLFSQNTVKTDSLVRLLSLEKDSSKVKLYYQLYEHIKKNDADSALIFLKKGIELANGLSNSNDLRFEGYNQLSEFWFAQGAYDSVKSIAKKALEIDTISKTPLKIWTYNSLGKAYLMTSRHSESIEWFIKALQLAEDTKNFEGIQVLTNNIGNVHWSLNNFDKAELYYKSALEMSYERKLEHNAALALSNLGMVYQAKNRRNEALDSYEKAIAIGRRLDHKADTSIYLQNLGDLYLEVNEYDKAYSALTEANQISNLISDKTGMIFTLIKLAKICTKTNKYNDAIKLLDESFELVKEMNYKIGYEQIYMAYSEVYSKKGDYKKAFENRKLYAVSYTHLTLPTSDLV